VQRSARAPRPDAVVARQIAGEAGTPWRCRKAGDPTRAKRIQGLVGMAGLAFCAAVQRPRFRDRAASLDGSDASPGTERK
jgi:hypothetical protein